MNQKQKLIDTFVPPAIVAATAIAGSMMLNGVGVVPMFGYAVPSSVAVGVTAGGSSLVSGVLFNYAVPHLPHNLRSAEAEKLLLKPVITGLSNYAVLKACVPETTGANGQRGGVDFMPNFLTGVGAELVGQQTANAVKSFAHRHI